MTVRRGITFAFAGALVAAVGFLIGRGIGGDGTTASELGSAPVTLSIDKSDAATPQFDSVHGLPGLATTISEVLTEGGGSELEGEANSAAGQIEEGPVKPEPEKKEPIKVEPPPEPDITVGGSEE